jgi:alanine-alpha-ketoisovalerate/valine-pyruvate aminotransferase
MLETIPDMPEGIVAIKAVGTITAEDYASVVESMFDGARADGRRLRVLLQLGPEYEGFTAGAVWEKAGIWMRHPGLWHEIEGYALVSDIHWVAELVHLAGLLVPFPMRVFGNDALDEAAAWLASSAEHSTSADLPQGA